MKFKVGDYVENFGYMPHKFYYGIIVDNTENVVYTVAILCNNGEVSNEEFAYTELKLLKDKDKINYFNKLRVFK